MHLAPIPFSALTPARRRSSGVPKLAKHSSRWTGIQGTTHHLATEAPRTRSPAAPLPSASTSQGSPSKISFFQYQRQQHQCNARFFEEVARSFSTSFRSTIAATETLDRHSRSPRSSCSFSTCRKEHIVVAHSRRFLRLPRQCRVSPSPPPPSPSSLGPCSKKPPGRLVARSGRSGSEGEAAAPPRRRHPRPAALGTWGQTEQACGPMTTVDGDFGRWHTPWTVEGARA